MSRISQEKKGEIRKKILSVSKKLFLKQGYYNTSTLQIAQEVGIAEGTIFNYFETKVDIFLVSVIEDYFSSPPQDDKQPKISFDVVDMIMNYINDKLSRILMLPKNVLIDLSTALVGKATHKKNITGELNLIDQYYIEKLVNFITYLQRESLIKETNAKTLGECMFGIVFMELFIYLNIESYTKDDVITGIKEKISVLMVGHLVSD